MAYMDAMDSETGFMPAESERSKGQELAERYAAGDPFPWIVIDDFLPTPLAQAMIDHFGPKVAADHNQSFDRSQERRKSSYHPDTMDDRARTVFYAFNSRPFIKVLENITGIKGLIPDPYYVGAGFHEIQNGGHLSVHADFNHHKPMNLERRINVLIYLNKDWQEEYGGQIELWTTDMSRKVHSLDSTFNRCVIFNTTSDSMHGNPNVVAHPDGVSRKSIALYYYTSTWDSAKRSHTTQFRPRPGTVDRADWSVRLREWREDLLPPIVVRNAARAGRLMQRTLRR